MRTVTCISVFLCSMLAAQASHPYCFEEAAARYGLPIETLKAVSKQESGMRADIPPSWNTDGSYDIGIMRINSNWYHWSPYVRDLWPQIEEPCTNVMVGAWILAGCLRQYGNTWEGIGCYNSRTPSKRDKYARDIARILYGPQSQQARQQ